MECEFELFKFLARFNAIFTLNQDTLLETRYHGRDLSLLTGNRVSSHCIPGMTPQPKPPIPGDQSAPVYFPADTFSIPPHSQPLIKLHGSSNWRSQNRDLLIVGGDKQAAIAREPVLAQNAAAFVDYLSRPDTRLMVIGYSFGDFHINKAIEDAAGKGQLRLFIVDPNGIGVLNMKGDRAAIPYTEPLAEKLWPRTFGASRRPLLATFGASDLAERDKLEAFIA